MGGPVGLPATTHGQLQHLVVGGSVDPVGSSQAEASRQSLVDGVRSEEPGYRGVIEVDPLSDPRWEAFVAAHPEGLIYHHPTWLRTLALEYGRKPVGLAYEVAGELRGLLPLFPTRGLPLWKGEMRAGRRLSSLPRTPIAGPLAFDREATVALIEAAIDRVREHPSFRLEIKTASPDLAEVVSSLSRVPWRSSYVLKLPERVEQIHFGDSRNHSRIRWAVNRATKAGVQVRPAETIEELRAWYQLYLETMRTHCVPTRSFRFFQIVWEIMRPLGLMRLLLAEQCLEGRRKILAGSVLLIFGQTVFYAFNGRHREYLSLRPNDLIQWHAIRAACEEGFRHYDLGEVAADRDSLGKFKEKWGANAVPLYRYYYPAPHKVEIGTQTPDGHVRRFASSCWRRLPLGVTSFLGDWVWGYS